MIFGVQLITHGKIEKIRTILVNNDNRVRFPTGTLGSTNEQTTLCIAYVVRLISFPYQYVSSTTGSRNLLLSVISQSIVPDYFCEKSPNTRMRTCYVKQNQCWSDMCCSFAALSPDQVLSDHKTISGCLLHITGILQCS